LGNTATLTTTPTVGTNTFILIVDINGCTGTDTVVINYFPLPIANAGADINILNGTSTTLGGSPTTSSSNTVVWVPSNDVTDTTAFNPTASPDSTITYTVYVTDANGCVASDDITIVVLPDIIFPNGFSPNGDGDNDVWIIDFISEFPDCEVEVFNRWGQPIFYSKGYATPWDGTYNGNPVTVGTYYYVIKLNHPLYPNDFVGPLTILR
jgi:gliding motility-associated-like protein